MTSKEEADKLQYLSTSDYSNTNKRKLKQMYEFLLTLGKRNKKTAAMTKRTVAVALLELI